MGNTWKPNLQHKSVLSCVGLDWEQDPQSWEWRYGSPVALLSNQPDESPDGRYYMTGERLVNHVGLLEDVYNNPLAMDFYQAYPHEYNLRKRMAIIEFDRKILRPIRKYLEEKQESTFYRVSVLEYKIHPKTGLVVFVSQSEPVLKLLPLSKGVGEKRGMKKTHLKLIMPDVIYVILMKKRAYRTIKDADHLLYYLDSWMELIRDGDMRNAIYKTFKEKSPILVDNRVTQLMLSM